MLLIHHRTRLLRWKLWWILHHVWRQTSRPLGIVVVVISNNFTRAKMVHLCASRLNWIWTVWLARTSIIICHSIMLSRSSILRGIMLRKRLLWCHHQLL